MNTSDDSSPPSLPETPGHSGPSFQEGQKLAGVFVLRREMPATAGERIWLAHDEILGKDVSLHFVPDSLRADERAMGELRNEIKRNRQLIHPGILRVYDLIEESGWVAVSMDWFEGESIASLLQNKGSFSVAEAEPIARQLCKTLDDVHKINVVHRNLTPANLFIDAQGKLLIAKFGVSRVIEDALGRQRKRDAGPDAKLAYLSPQQLDGESPTKFDDIYSLGGTLFQLLTGSLPYAGADLLTQIRRSAVPTIASKRQGGAAVPGSWEKTIATCLAKNPQDRPQTAAAVAQSLELGAAKGGSEVPAAVAATAGALAAAAAAKPKETPAPAVAPAATPASKSDTKKLTPEKVAPMSKEVKTVETKAPAASVPAREVSRETKKSAPETKPMRLDDQENESAASGSAASEIYPDLYPRRSGAPMTVAALVALGAGIIGCLVYFNRQSVPTTASATSSPVNKTVAISTPKPAPAVANVEPSTPTPASASELAKVTSTPSPSLAMATPPAAGGVLEGEQDLTKIDPSEPTTTGEKASGETLIALPSDRFSGIVAANPANTARPSAPNQTRTGGGASATPAHSGANPAGRNPAPATPTPAMATTAKLPAGDIKTMEAQVERLRVESGKAEKALTDAQKKQQNAEAALVEAQKGVENKANSLKPLDTSIQPLLSEQQKRTESVKAAETAAKDARQAAEEQKREADQKARVAEDAKKALTDWEMLNKSKLAQRDKANAELESLKSALETKKQEAADAAKTISDLDANRQRLLATMRESTEQVEAAKAAKAKADEDAAAEAKRVEDDRLAKIEEEKKFKLKEARAAMAEELKKMREEMDRKIRDLENLDAAPSPSTPGKSNPPGANPTPGAKPATPVRATPRAAAVEPPLPMTPAPVAVMATPAPATPMLALVTPRPATPAPATPVQVVMISTPAPVIPVLPPPSLASTPAPIIPSPVNPPVSAESTDSGLDKTAFENSLGQKFVPVGDVLFAVWPTRVQDFEVFALEANVRSSAWRSPGFKQGPSHPVVNVSWIDGMAFCKWLTEREHKKNVLSKDQYYRLPTDLEWSRAVGLSDESGKTPADRDMGIPDVFPWGTQWPPPPRVGNYTGEETGSDVAIRGYDDGFPWTSPVGSFPPNKYGLYDMGGNVWQWCMDSWNSENKAKVLRGASWYNGALKLSLLSSCRVHYSPELYTDNYGFRIVRASDTAKSGKR